VRQETGVPRQRRSTRATSARAAARAGHGFHIHLSNSYQVALWVGMRTAVDAGLPGSRIGSRCDPSGTTKPTLRRPGRPIFRPRKRTGWRFLLSLADEGGEAPRGAGAERRTEACHDAARERHLARRLAPHNAGRSPPGAPPRHYAASAAFSVVRPQVVPTSVSELLAPGSYCPESGAR